MSESGANRVQQIFLAALKMPKEQRAAWLAEVCGDDRKLLNDLQSLLEHDEPDDDVLEKGLNGAMPDFPHTEIFTESDVHPGDEHKTIVGCDLFLEKLSEVGVLSPDEFDSMSETASANDRAADPRQLASQLVLEGKLTEYQASALLKGKPDLLIDKYLILDLIDVGGMGMVFKAIHRTMNRVVAVKMISQQLLSSPEQVKRFQREVRVAATLEHPNIVRSYDADQTGGVHFLVMEYVRGRNLHQIARTSGPLPLSQAVDCIRQSAVGLQHAHEHGIVHRDIKPGNLLLDDRGIVKVLDLGLAHVDESFQEGTSESDSKNKDSGRPYVSRMEPTAAGTILGTASFMAPEQSLDAHLVDFRSDVYSLGCTFYFLLTGDTPYSGSTVFKVFVQHREGEIPSLQDKRPDVPDSIESVYRQMVAKKPEDRFQSMSDLIVALDKCQIALPAPTNPVRRNADVSVSTEDQATVVEPELAANATTTESQRKPVALWALFAIVATLVVATLYWPEDQIGSDELTTDQETLKISGAPVNDLNSTLASDVDTSVSDDSTASAADLIATGRWEWKLDKKLLEPINSPDTEFGADMTDDGLMIVVSSSNGVEKSDRDLFFATRASRKAPWSELTRLPVSVNSKGEEISPVFSDNGMSLSFVRRSQEGLFHLKTRRGNDGSKWSAPEELERNPLGKLYSLTRDGLTAFRLQRQTPSNSKIEHVLNLCRRASTDEPFGDVETSSLGDSGLPTSTATLSNDGRLLIYIQDEAAAASLLSRKFFMVTRVGWDSPWSRPVPILPTLGGIQAPCLQFGNRTLLCSSNGPNAAGGRHDIYMARLVEKSQPTEQSVRESPADLLASGEWKWQVEKNLGPTINSPAIVFGADMTADELTIVFSSLRQQQPPGNRDLWIASRSSQDAPWSEPVRLPSKINTDSKEEQPRISGDGLSLWFRRDGNTLMYSVREGVDVSWSEAIHDPYSIGMMKNYETTPNGLTAFRPGKLISDHGQTQTSGRLMIWRRGSRDFPFGDSSESLLPIVSPNQNSGTLSDDTRMYVFTQEIDNGKEARQSRLFISTRSNRDVAWSAPNLLFPDISDDMVSSGSPRLLDDNCTLLFTSNMDGGEGSFDIWQARLVLRNSQQNSQ
ncbi:MAG: serine/threonine protein kinase [Rhodopirellula sp.]|nr:serine/threonine protein kinase [Rhodopirellula sp.]